MRLPAAREGPAPGGAAAGPGRAGSEGSAERGDGAEVGAPFHPLLPNGPAPALPPELRGELALSFRRLPVRKVGPAGPDGPALWRVAEGLLPAVASAQEVPGADAQLRKIACGDGLFLPPQVLGSRKRARPGPARGALRQVVGRRRCGDARGRGRGGGWPPPAESDRRPFARGPGARPRSSPRPARRAPSSCPSRGARRSPPASQGREPGGGGGDCPKCFLAVGFALLRF